MKKYSKEVINSTMDIHKKTLKKSKKWTDKLTRPSKKISCVGSSIGTIIGIGFILYGVIKVVSGSKLIASSSFFVGICTIVSNIINIRRTQR